MSIGFRRSKKKRQTNWYVNRSRYIKKYKKVTSRKKLKLLLKKIKAGFGPLSAVLPLKPYFKLNVRTGQSLTPEIRHGLNYDYLIGLKNQFQIKKVPLSFSDKIFYYYQTQIQIPIYAHKAFILLEIQLNSLIARAKLVPYFFIVLDLCFYRIIKVNTEIMTSPFYVTALFDSIVLPVYLYNYIYFRQYRVQRYPLRLALYFKSSITMFSNSNNRIWLLSNYITSSISAETIIFEYPSMLLYISPFQRFSTLYYRNQPTKLFGFDVEQETVSWIIYSHTILKIKLFTYLSFYK